MHIGIPLSPHDSCPVHCGYNLFNVHTCRETADRESVHGYEKGTSRRGSRRESKPSCVYPCFRLHFCSTETDLETRKAPPRQAISVLALSGTLQPLMLQSAATTAQCCRQPSAAGEAVLGRRFLSQGHLASKLVRILLLLCPPNGCCCLSLLSFNLLCEMLMNCTSCYKLSFSRIEGPVVSLGF